MHTTFQYYCRLYLLISLHPPPVPAPCFADETTQHELIYTVSNDSDARTQWRGSDGVVYSVTPPANSLLLFRADAAWHRVVGAETGERIIVKALYTEDFAKTEAFAETMASAPWRR